MDSVMVVLHGHVGLLEKERCQVLCCSIRGKVMTFFWRDCSGPSTERLIGSCSAIGQACFAGFRAAVQGLWAGLSNLRKEDLVILAMSRHVPYRVVSLWTLPTHAKRASTGRRGSLSVEEQ